MRKALVLSLSSIILCLSTQVQTAFAGSSVQGIGGRRSLSRYIICNNTDEIVRLGTKESSWNRPAYQDLVPGDCSKAIETSGSPTYAACNLRNVECFDSMENRMKNYYWRALQPGVNYLRR